MLLALLVVSVALAGCVGGDDEVGPDNEEAQQEDEGSIELNAIGADESTLTGQVVSESLDPLASATVVVQELEENTTTNVAGRFKLEGLEPGKYTVFAQADGYKVQRTSVELVAGKAAAANFILERLPSETPHVLVDEQVGFLECQTGAVVVTMNCVPIQNVLNDLGTNPTNTKQILKFEFDPKGLEAVVAEMVWNPPIAGTAEELQLLVEQDSTDLVEGGRYGRAQSESPVRVELTGWENLPKAENNDTLGVFQTRTFPPFEPGTIVFQQKFTIFVSYFYYQLPTPGYTGIPDGFRP